MIDVGIQILLLHFRQHDSDASVIYPTPEHLTTFLKREAVHALSIGNTVES